MPVREGFDFKKIILDPIDKFFKDDIVKPMKKAFVDDLGKPVKKAFTKGMDPTKGIDSVIKEFNSMVKFLGTMGRRFENVFAGMGNIFMGLGLYIAGVGKGLGLGLEQMGILFVTVGEFIFTYLACILKMIISFPFCIFFYIIVMVLQILYIPVRIGLWCSKEIFGVDLYEKEKQAWSGMRELSYFVYKYTGYHFIYFPKFIRQQCFVCVRLKSSTIERKGKEIDNAFNVKLPAFIKNGDKALKRAGKQFSESGAMPKPRHPRHVK